MMNMEKILQMKYIENLNCGKKIGKNYMSKIRSLLRVKQFSEQTLRKYIKDYDERQWDAICTYQILSEQFMREFRDYFSREIWKSASKKQRMSIDFRREMFLLKEKTI